MIKPCGWTSLSSQLESAMGWVLPPWHKRIQLWSAREFQIRNVEFQTSFTKWWKQFVQHIGESFCFGVFQQQNDIGETKGLYSWPIPQNKSIYKQRGMDRRLESWMEWTWKTCQASVISFISYSRLGWWLLFVYQKPKEQIQGTVAPPLSFLFVAGFFPSHKPNHIKTCVVDTLVKCFLTGSTITIKRFSQQAFDNPKGNLTKFLTKKNVWKWKLWTWPMAWLCPIDLGFREENASKVIYANR